MVVVYIRVKDMMKLPSVTDVFRRMLTFESVVPVESDWKNYENSSAIISSRIPKDYLQQRINLSVHQPESPERNHII